MNKCLLLGLLFVASLIGSLLLFSDVSKAQTPYDNMIGTATNLELEFPKPGNPDEYVIIDITDDYFDEVKEALRIRCEDRKQTDYCDAYNVLDTYSGNGLIAVTTSKARSAYQMTMYIVPYIDDIEENSCYFYSYQNGNRQLRCESDYPVLRIGAIGHQGLTNFETEKGIGVYGTPAYTNTYSYFTISSQSANEDSGDRWIYFSEWPVQYPPDYNGMEMPGSPPIQQEDKTFLPEWSWSITQDGKFTVSSQNNENANLDAEAVFDLWKDSKDWQFPSTEVVDAERQRPYHSAKFEHQLEKEEQWITVTLDYHDQFCLMEGTCESELPEDITHVETVIFQIYWDGKSFIAGNNANGQDDCELQEDGGIYRRICNAEDQEPVIMRTLRSLNNDMHGLTQIVTAPLSFIASLITYNNNCTNLVLPLPNAMDRDLALPCMTPYYQQYLGFLFNLYQTILTALVCYYCFVNTLAFVKRGQNPKDDRIEVAHL